MAEISSGVYISVNKVVTYKVFELVAVRHLDHGLSALVDNLEGKVGNVLFDIAVRVGAADQTFGVKDGVFRILRGLVLGGVTNQTFVVGEANP